MGNSMSDNEEEGKADCSINPDEDLSDGQDDSDDDHKPLTDLCQLFEDNATLRALATKVKEKIPENVILQHHAHILSWLEGRQEMGEENITLAQFCDMMMSQGVERPDAVKAFHQFDCDGSGMADMETMTIAIETYSSRSALGELGKSIRILQSCSLTPGFVDLYAGTSNVEKHGTRMLKYLLRNRVESKAMPFPYLSSFYNVQIMRTSVLQSALQSNTLADKEPETEMDGDDYEKRTIENCYSNLEVSSNSSDSQLLRHPSMYWQSDGAARSHWVRIQVRPQVVIKHLSIGVSSTDQSYMPEQVIISVGHTTLRMRDIKEVKIQNHVNGQVVLLKNMKAHYPIVQINIRRCHGDGCDTRIHGIKMTGYRMIKDAGMSVMDASALWYLQVLTSTVTFTLPQSPALRTTLLSHTKRALETMPPLCLSTASPDRPPFLNKHVLQEMESFTGLLSESDDGGPCVDGLQIRLALNLARGSVAGLLKLITSFMGSKELTLPCADLLSKALAARSLCWEKIAVPLTVKCEGSDGGRGPLNTGPEVVLESQTSSTNVRDGASSSASSSRVYLTDEGKTFCTMLFKAEENVQLSKVRIQVASGVKGPQHGMVFVYNPECVEGLSDKADFDEHIKYFSKYDFWGDTEFKFSIAYRDSGLGGLPDNPVAFFKFEQDWDELEVPIQWSATGRYIMVKFLDPRHAFATRLGIKTIRLFGIPRPAPMARDIEKTVVVSNNPKKSSCTLSEIVLVILTFISDIAVDQLKRKNRLSSYKPPMDFLDLSDLDVMTLWNLHHICTQRHQEAVSDGAPKKVLDQWQHSAILALHLIHGLIPVLASSKVTSQMSRDSLFQELCQYINQEGKEDGTQQQQQESQKTDAIKRHKLTLIRQIIIDGAPLFFPEKTKKRNELFKLLEYVSDQSGQPSTSLVFQSLCQFFSAVDPKGLLELPSSPNKDFSPSNALGMMKSLLLVACQEKTSTLLTPPLESPPTPTSTQHNGPNSQTGKDPHDAKIANTGNKAETDEKAGCAVETNQSSGDGGENPTQQPTDFVDGVTALRSGSSVDAIDTSTPSSSPDNKKQKEEEMKEKDLNPQGGEASSPSLNSSPSATSQPESNSAASDNDSCDTTKAVVCSPDDDSHAGKDKDKNGVGRGAAGQGMTYLVKLTTSLQGALMTWCWQQLDHLNAQEDSQALLKVINHVVANYTQQVMDNALLSLEGMKDLTQEQMKKKSSLDEPSFLCNIVRQQCLFLSLLVDKINTETRVKILESSKKVLNLAGVIARANPDLFTDNTSPKVKDTESEDTVLRTWEVESPHEYHNHSNINQMFHCPGATKFVIDFDPRCETERRYDYLEFVDAKGLKMRLDHKVGMAKWPKQVTFSGPHVSFLFHSDSSNTEWGYKFTVTAKGSPDVPFSWLMDLHLGLVKVLGRMSGAILASNPTLPQDPLNATVEDRDGEQDILRSDLWTSLFRGGYRQGGKLQRSLSGKFATGDDSEIHSFLLEVVHHFDGVKSPENSRSDSEERQRSQVARFLVKCRESWTSKSQVRPGGMAVDKALMSVFVALLWHCQQLREDVDKFIQSDSQGEITEGIVKAYNMAESLRLKLASERQTWNGNDDKEEDQDPAQLLSSKCMFLLKFAGLTKVQLKNELRSKFYKQMMLKKAGNKPVIRNEVLDKYPSFRLVMEFVQDPAWTSQRVHQLLQERTEFASAIRDVYMFASETVRILSDGNPFQIPVVLYLQEMFSYQSQFSHHYADGLDGCGLEQEAQVRQAFYKLVRILVQPFKGRWINNDQAGHQGYLLPVYDMVQCCLLHLLDIEWQPYDLSFVNDLCLPQLYFNIAKETVKMRDLKVCEQNEEEELKQYEQTMIWFHEVSDGLNSWFRKKSEQSKDDKKAVKMFVARFSDVLDVEISCDGCSVTLPGRRYRCLQCLDMDLCTSCFSGGVEPQEHRDDHEIVHLVYKCNHCQAFIMGKRIHCNQCDDFDLCLGCHTKKKFPHGHNQDHDVTIFPMVKLKTSQSSNSPLRAYIHQHSWLMYTSLTLTLSDLVYGQDNGYSFLDPDYIRMAGQLQMQCVALATQCLQHNIDVEKTDGLSVEKRMEESFARHSQERVMGLLGAVMPSHEKRDVMSISGFNFWTQEFLDLLLGVTRGDHNHELNTQHQALRLMGRLLLATDIPAVTTPTPAATPAVPNGASATSLVPSTADQDKQYLAGKETISLLFSHGAKEFERRGLEWACSVARMLEMLFASSQWRPVINAHITQCVQNLTQKVDLACIFPMFVVAGFPEVLTTGTLVEYNDTSVDTQKGVVLKHFPDKYQTLIVNLASRKRHTVKDQWVSCYTDNTNTWDSGSLDKFVNYVIHIVGKIRMGEDLSVETLWVLSLTLKVLDRCLKAHQEGVGGCLGEELSSHAFIQALVFLACKGTSLNHHWLLRDLEVLSLIWYTQDGNVSKRTKISNLKDKSKKKKDKKDAAKRYDHYLMTTELIDENDDDDDDDDDDDVNKGNTDEKEDEDYINRTKGKDSDDDDDDDDDDDSDSSTPDIDDDDDDDDDDDGMDDDSIWESMSDEDSLDDIVEEETWEDLKVDSSTKALLETLHRELNFDPFVLTAVYKMNKGNMEEVIKSLIDNAVEKDSVSEVIDKWKATKSEGEDSGGGGGGKKEAGSTDTNTIDTGVSLHTSVGTHHKIPEVAEKEKGYNLQNLFTHHDKLESAIKKKQRAWSSSLFKKEVEKHGRSGSREYLLKINLALCVLYGRHTLTSLLAQWPPTGPAINSTLLGCKDVKQIPCVLDLLHKIDTRDFFSKVVDKVIHLCDGPSLVAIAYTAAQFMEEVTLSAVTRESNHPYTQSDIKKGHITLPGASYLTITFDNRCATAEEDTLIFSTRAQMDKDDHTFSGLSRDCWTSFHLPGDSLYYKFYLDDFDSDLTNHWGYKFTVTAGTRDSFETGHTILEAVLSSPIARSLPLGQLWDSLIYVSVKQAGLQRLKAIHLMLKILGLQHKGDNNGDKAVPDIDLCLLRPLWELYESLTPDPNDSNILQPAAVGALTDLFLKVEELASEWGLAESYLVSLISKTHLRNVFMQGLRNVAIVGQDIKWPNVASQAVMGPQAAQADKALRHAISGKGAKTPTSPSQGQGEDSSTSKS